MSVARGKQKARRACVPSQARAISEASYLGLNPQKYWTRMLMYLCRSPANRLTRNAPRFAPRRKLRRAPRPARDREEAQGGA